MVGVNLARHAVIGCASLLLGAGCGRLHFDDLARADAAPDTLVADGTMPEATFVQIAGDGNVVPITTLLVPYGADITAGDLLIVCFNVQAVTTPIAVTDTLGDTFTQTPTTTNQYLEYAIANADGPDSITVTLDMPSSGYEMWIVEYAGRTVLDDSSSVTGVASASLSTTTLTTTGTNDLVIGGFVGGGTLGMGPGFTLRSNMFNDVFEDFVAPTPGTYDVTADVPAGNGWFVSAAAFR